MGNFNRGGDRGGFGGNRGGGFGGSRGGFGGGKSFGDRGGDRGGRNEMHDAICAGCQKSCQVPFRPNGKKPVFCTECFANNGGASKPSFNSFPKKDFGDRQDSRPAMRPAFNNDNAGAGNNDTKKQLETINIKLDRLIKAIEGMTKTLSLIHI